MAFKHYLEEEDDKPYFTTNSLGYYYDKMEGFSEKVEQAAKTLNVTKEEVEKNITAYIEQNKNELDQRLAQWDGKLETFDSSVETLLTEWVDDGTLTHVIDSTLIDQKIAPVTAQLADIAVNVSLFGAIGDGITDDTNAIESALNSGKNILFSGVYRITRRIVATYQKGVKLYSETGATFFFDPATHEETMFHINIKGGKMVFRKLNFHVNKMANSALYLSSENTTMESVLPSVEVDGCYVEKVKKLKQFTGGSGIYVRGGYEESKIINTKIFDCEMPAGQGTSGVTGISGIVIGQTAGLFTKTALIDNISVEKVYSSDLSYESDQDGISCLTPAIEKSFLRVTNSSFKNCYGRSIKSQFTHTRIANCDFLRTEGFASKGGNGDIDLQKGGSVENCVFTYKNGYSTTCIGTGSVLGLTPRFSVKSCDVFVDEGTILKSFASTYPRDGFIGVVFINDISIEGDCQRFFDYRVNGPKNKATISNVRLKNLIQGDNTDYSFINVTSSGSISPQKANLIISDCNHEGTGRPFIVSSRVPGVQANAYVSAYQNEGFSDSSTAEDGETIGLKGRQQMKVGRIGPTDFGITTPGFFEVKTAIIAAGETAVMEISNATGALVNVVFNANENTFASFYSYRNTNILIAKGTSTDLVLTGIPTATPLFLTVWVESGKLFIKNGSTATRVATVSILSTR